MKPLWQERNGVTIKKLTIPNADFGLRLPVVRECGVEN
jgi:hypothetical protein